mgnify:CR=1 FL=1
MLEVLTSCLYYPAGEVGGGIILTPKIRGGLCWRFSQIRLQMHTPGNAGATGDSVEYREPSSVASPSESGSSSSSATCSSLSAASAVCARFSRFADSFEGGSRRRSVVSGRRAR